jgi:hypothetical protein
MKLGAIWLAKFVDQTKSEDGKRTHKKRKKKKKKKKKGRNCFSCPN